VIQVSDPVATGATGGAVVAIVLALIRLGERWIEKRAGESSQQRVLLGKLADKLDTLDRTVRTGLRNVVEHIDRKL
jgi:hypothetical protein